MSGFGGEKVLKPPFFSYRGLCSFSSSTIFVLAMNWS